MLNELECGRIVGNLLLRLREDQDACPRLRWGPLVFPEFSCLYLASSRLRYAAQYQATRLQNTNLTTNSGSLSSMLEYDVFWLLPEVDGPSYTH